MDRKLDLLKESMKKYRITTDQLKESLAKDIANVIKTSWSIDEVYSYLTNQSDRRPKSFSFDGDAFLKCEIDSWKPKKESNWFINKYIKEISEMIYGNFDFASVE